LKVEWFPDWLKLTQLAILREESKKQFKEHELLLVKNSTKNKSIIVRAVSINDAIFSEIEELVDFTSVFDSDESILLSKKLKNVLEIAESDWITIESPQINLFTYGTFLSAFWDFTNSEYPFLVFPGSRHYVLEEFHFLRAKLQDFQRIWPPGLSFPFITPDEGFVLGEIYFDVSQSKFVELDRIEGEGYLYNRANVSVELLDAPFKGIKVNAVTYVGADSLVSEHPKQPTFDRLTFGDVYYIQKEDTWQEITAIEEMFIKYINGTIPILISTYSPALESYYRGDIGKIFETSLNELCIIVDEITKEIFLQDEKQLPYALIETFQNIWSPEILDNYTEKNDLIEHIETTCNSFIEKMQQFTNEIIEQFGQCILLILKSHSQNGADLTIKCTNEILDVDLLTKNLKLPYQLSDSAENDRILEDLLIQSNTDKMLVITIKINEEILVSPLKRESLAQDLADILRSLLLT
jgi:gamma-glutamylcyclotransferase (GGCT)/AIG2-like uncharacterized protein YtfP